jgi:glycerophosphoryl diester phosphodiesterase
MRAALEAGARYVECDVLLSSDGVPVLMHDATLMRTAGRPEAVAALSRAELSTIEVAERPRLGDAGAGERVPGLDDLCRLLQHWPDATAFVEIKRAALVHFGTDRVVTRVLETVAPIRDRVVVISFSPQAVERAQASSARAGWVIERYDEPSRAVAARLSPEFLFCNHEKFAAAPARPWSGPWEWVAYEVTDAGLALALAARGVRYVESMAVGELLAALDAARR